MTIIQLTGHITEDGKLEVELPSGLPAGEVEVIVRVEKKAKAVNEDDDTPLTDEEIEELLIPKPVPAHLIVGGGWEHMGIEDSVEWVNELRPKEVERRRALW
jgi:metal-dependent hydrolase (beta-lactamase superfamily II)